MRECAACKQVFDDTVAVCPHDGSPLVSANPLIGQIFEGRYRIESLIGSGGMGSVYRATQLNLDRTVAVKIISAGLSDPASLDRFKREALVVARLRHPNIVSVYDFGAAPGVGAYIVMEYVPGTPLSREIKRRGQLPIDQAVDLMAQVCDAIAEAHASGVIHRDIKPHNILLEEAREGFRVKVLDFGIAKLWGETDADGITLTKTGSFLGTPVYMAPELWSGEEASIRSDIYALGCVLYEVLTGKPPFSGGGTIKLMRLHTAQTPALPSLRRPGVNPALDAVVMRALAKEPASRYGTAAELADMLVPATTATLSSRLTGGAHTGPPSASTTGWDPIRLKLGFVGRNRELAELSQRLDLAMTGECQLVLVAGDAGIGKTRLVDEFETLARSRGVRVLHGCFAEADQAFSYDGFFQVVREHLRAGTEPGGSLADHLPDLLTLFPMLAEIDPGRTPPTMSQRDFVDTDASPPDDRTSVFETLASTLTRIAGGRPLAVCFEELHKANVSIEALQYVVRRLVTVPLLIVGTYRADEIDKRHPLVKLLAAFRGDRRFALVELGPLSESEHRHLVEAVFEGPAEDDLVARLFQVTEGNPYFATELARSLKESGDLSGDSGAWQLTTGAGLLADALPETVQETVRQRIEELSDDDRDVLSVASVLGRDFDYRDLEALAGDVERSVERLVDRGFLEEDRRTRGDRLVFTSAVVREVLYAALPKRKRRSLHRRHAEQLEDRYAGKLGRVLPQLVHHFVHADEAEKVFEYGIALVRRSLESHAADEALRVAQIALEFAREEGDSATQGEVSLLLARAQRARGSLGAALSELETAAKAFEQAGRADRALEAMESAADVAWEGRRTEQARRWVEAGLVAARAASATEPLARLLALGATIANLGGEHERARAYLEEAAALGPAPDRVDEVPRGGRLGVALVSELRACHPAEARFVHEFEVLANAFEPLLTWDTRGGLEPLLAEAWEAAPDGREFLFTLRDGVRFHDGRTLTADEVRASFERATRLVRHALPAALAAVAGAERFADGAAERIEGLEVVSERQLRIRLEDPLPIYPALLTDIRAAVACEPAAGDEYPSGTGPFVLRKFETGGALLERNDDYWREPARLDALEFHVVPQSAERAAGVRAGEIDVAGGFEPADLDALLSVRPARTSFVEAARKSTCFVLFNQSRPISNAPGAARALTEVVRVHDLVRGTLGRFAHPAEGLLPPGILGHDPARRREPLAREAAAEALRQSGIAMPVALRASISPVVQARFGAVLEALFGEWAELGVTVSVETPTLAAHTASWEAAADFDFTLQEWEADYDDPDNFTYALFHSKGGLFRDFYCSPELDRLIEQARGESKPATREGLYRKIEEHLLATGLFLPLYHGVEYRVASAPVRRMTLEGAPPFVSYARMGKVEPAGADAVARPGRVAIHVPVPSDFSSIDPCAVSSVGAIEASLTVFETLVRPNAHAQIVPWLAADFRLEARGRRYWFALRDDVHFHDGRRLTVRDVRYSFERLLRSGGDYDQLLLPIRGAKAFRDGEANEIDGFRILSSSEFALDLDRPLSILPALLTCGPTAIVPEGTETASGTWRTGCAGTGPFRVVRAVASGHVELEANPQYWRPGLPRTERLSFTGENESSARRAGFEAGRFSIGWMMARADEQALLHDAEHAGHGLRIPEIATTVLLLNATRGPLADEATRHRLIAAFDRDAFVRQVEGQDALVAHGLIPPGLLGHEPHAITHPPAADGQATLPVELAITMTPPLRTAWGTELLRWLARLGIRAKIVNETYAEYEEAVGDGTVDVVAVGWNFDYPDADSIVHGAMHSSGRYGSRFVANAEIDRLCEYGRAETDPDARHATYREIEEVVARHAHVIPLYHARRWCFTRAGLDGVELNLFQPYLSYEKLFVR